MTKVAVNPVTTDWYKCSKCKHSFFIKIDDPNKKRLLKNSMRCPNYVRCKGRITHRSWSNATEIRKFRWTTALELYQASAGLGFSTERDCSPDTLKKLLHGHMIMATDIHDTGDPKKSIIMSLTLETGKVLHLASSTKGAVVYKVTEMSHDS